MKKTLQKLAGTPLAIAIAAGGFIVVPGMANATKCSITFSCEQTTMMESSKVQNRISAMQEAVSEAVYTIGDNIVSAIADSTAGITGAMAKNTASANNNAAEIDKANNRRAEEKTRSKTAAQCGNAGASQGPRSGGSMGSRPSTGPNSDYRPSNVSDRMKRAMDASGMTNTPSIPPEDRETQVADYGTGGCQTFSDPNTVRGLLCKLINAVSEGRSPFPDADIKASTLFDGPQKKGGSNKSLSVPANGPERDARAAYLTTLTNASPPVTPREAVLKSPEGRLYMGARAEYEGSQSLANYPAHEFDRLTTVDPATLAALQVIQQSDPAFVSRYFKDLDPSSYQNGVSALQLMDIEVERRIGNEDWLKRMAAATAEDKAAEQLLIDAYSLRIQRDHYMAQLQTNVILGKLLQNSSETRYRDDLELSRGSLEVNKAKADSKAPSTSAGSRP